MTQTAWWRNEEWDRSSFTWDLWYGCNYRCSYCWWEMEDLWEGLAKKHKLLPPAEWAGVWERVYDRVGEARLDVIGGEPLRYPKAAELFEALSRRHRISITTNLSSSQGEMDALCDKLGPERLHFSASWHPQFARWDEFVAKVKRLQERGYEPGVTLVAWPPVMDRLPEWRSFFRGMNVPFSTLVFQGKHEGREYPGAYTAGQRALLETTIPERDEVEYRLNQRKTLGKPCGAGHVYANVKGDGQVFRCGQDAFGQKPLGNLFDTDFKLHDEPTPCPYDHCSCGEFYFLWEGWSAKEGRAAVGRPAPETA